MKKYLLAGGAYAGAPLMYGVDEGLRWVLAAVVLISFLIPIVVRSAQAKKGKKRKLEKKEIALMVLSGVLFSFFYMTVAFSYELNVSHVQSLLFFFTPALIVEIVSTVFRRKKDKAWEERSAEERTAERLRQEKGEAKGAAPAESVETPEQTPVALETPQPVPVAVSKEATANPKKTSKLTKALTVAMPVYYGVLFVVALVCLLTHAFDGVFARLVPSERDAGRATSLAVFLLILATTPSLGLYYAAASPYNLSKKVRKLIFAGSAVVLCGMMALYLVLTLAPYTEVYQAVGEAIVGNNQLPYPMLLLVFAGVGTVIPIVYYAILLSNREPQRGRVSRVGAIVNSVADEGNPIAIIVVTVLFTLLLPAVAIVLAALVVLAFLIGLILALISVVRSGSGGGSWRPSSSTEERWEVYDNGFKRTIQKTGSVTYQNGKQQTVYKDDIGREWLTDDDGNTFYRK